MSAAREGLPNEDELIRRIYAGRERWVELGDGKEVCIRRPDEWDSLSLPHDRSADRICRQVVDWRGFTEADLLGEGVGTIDPVRFSPRLFRVVAGDQLEWLQKILESVLELVTQHNEQKADTAKN